VAAEEVAPLPGAEAALGLAEPQMDEPEKLNSEEKLLP